MTERRTALSVSIPLWTLAVIALVFFLRFAQVLFIPIALAILISYALEPPVAWLQRVHVPRALGTTLLLLVFLGGSGWGVYTLRDEAAKAFEALPEAARRLRELVSSSGNQGPLGQVREAAAELGVAGQPSAGGQGEAEGKRPQSPGGGQQAPGGGGGSGGAMSGVLQRSATAVVNFAGQVTVVVFLVTFLLIYSGHFKNRVVEVAGSHGNRRITAEILREIDGQIERFIFVRVVTGAIVAVATWAALALMGVGQAVVWGILSGVFNSIPYFGPIIVSGGLAIVGVVQYGDVVMALKMSGVALAITTVEGWIITPLLLGKAEEMHPLVVFLGLVLWSWIWGVWGTILAVPMLAVIKSVCDHVEDLKPVGRLLGK